jgi:flagellar P-ring protein precursor FlgI
MAQAVNAFVRTPAARALDPGTVQLQIPPQYKGDVVALVTDVEQLRIEPDQPARVVIDEQNGVIVMGENVRISTVAIAQGNLTVRITETPQVSQPNPFAPGGNAIAPGGGAPGQDGVQFAPNGGAATTVVPRTQVQVDEQSERRLAVLPEGVSLRELVNGLNALGIGPRDMISILQAIKAAGALQAEIELM